MHNGELVILADLKKDELEPEPPKKVPAKFTELSYREKQIICLIKDEYTTDEIAKKLFRSKHTIERHRKNIMNKLDVKNVAGVVRVAMEYNLCEGIEFND